MVVRLTTAVAIFHVHPTLLGTAFLGVPAIGALDVFRWHVLRGPPPFLAAAQLVLFTLGWIIIALALRENAFAVTMVRLQNERRHAVVDTGIYGAIRHPMYAGNPLVLLGLSLWLGSYTSAVFACIPLGLLVVRITLEERFLQRTLPGYQEYMKRVPYRLLSGVW